MLLLPPEALVYAYLLGFSCALCNAIPFLLSLLNNFSALLARSTAWRLALSLLPALYSA